MSKNKSQSLTERIEALVNWIGKKPAPNLGDIKSELMTWRGIAEALENSEAIRESEAKITALESALEQSNAQNAKIKAELQTTRAEIKRFREEEKKRREKNADLPDDQFKILKALPSESDGFVQGKSIAVNLGIDTGDVDVHLSQLRELGYAFNFGHRWQRTIDGNRHIMAKRLAGDEEAKEPKPHNHGNLSIPEELVLLTMVTGKGGITAPEIVEKFARSLPEATLPLIQLLLIKLRGKKMATETNGAWEILNEGLDYLWDRDLL